MSKKIIRVIGIAVCALLFVLCVFMMVVSLLFGAEKIVDIFGYNMYLCEESSYAGLNEGSAVIVEQCEPYDLEQGNLILYTVEQVTASAQPAGETAEPAEKIPMLAYFEAAVMTDSVYYINITDSAEKHSQIMGSDLVGKATWSSPVLGKLIRFSLTPWGVLVMAVLPCLALIVFSMVKSAVDNAPPPEVIPIRKRNDEDDVKPESSLGLKADGNAEYSRPTGARPGASADSVLFTYGAKKSPATMKPSVPDPQQPTAAPAKPAAKPAASVPSSVAARRYIDSATAAQKKAAAKPVVNTAAKPAVNIEAKPAAVQEENKPQAPKDDTKVRSDTSALDAILSGATAEMPKMRKKTSSDAFFAQSDAPQIGRTGKSARSRAVIDLEDALATASAKESKKPANTSGRKSAAILASKSRSELMTDEDDSRDRSRYDVDDILSGIERRR